MAIDPEVVPSTSSAGEHALRHLPKSIVFGIVGIGVLIVVGILKMLLPLILMGLVIGFIWKTSSK